jgi:rhomboid protease GluP
MTKDKRRAILCPNCRKLISADELRCPYCNMARPASWLRNNALRFHRWWTLISANYLHGGIVHILFNMIAFYQLATLVNREYGAYRMIVIYTASGIAGFFVSYLAGVGFTIGASAAVCGLMGASLYYGKSRGGVYGRIIYKQIVGWAVGLFLFGLIVPGINNWAHGGGICAGAALGFLLGFQERRIFIEFLPAVALR